MKKAHKEINLELSYFSGNSQPENKFYEGGVCDPEFIDELLIWVEENEEYDEAKDAFSKNGGYQININGTSRSLFELGKYLIALSKYETDNQDYYDVFDDINSPKGKSKCQIVFHHANRLKKIKNLGTTD